MFFSPSRVEVVTPAVVTAHVPAVHTATADVGIDFPVFWQQHYHPIPGSQHGYHGYHGAHPTPHQYYPTYPAFVYNYYFPPMYFQSFHGTFNI
ncbi:hypothetical protein J0818_29545 [Bacillus cereus]|uniref:Uncharacterized protein n=1 Tax=Bacillus mobilis TaxID=2026190 RepID=A0A1Y5ZX79_9BACI|nr:MULTISPECIES: hypothetical protein [Bacillus cereus group]MBL3741311.1 hypothetical protein [Bacillus cereus]MBL3864129.1 hypothetical protein [Bacillus cereus]SME17025.1 hypothetical protein BACERE00185_03154 [Bacillus mobilis]HDR6770136.1 hypothetical protein [Bacillus cereus]